MHLLKKLFLAKRDRNRQVNLKPKGDPDCLTGLKNKKAGRPEGRTYWKNTKAPLLHSSLSVGPLSCPWVHVENMATPLPLLT